MENSELYQLVKQVFNVVKNVVDVQQKHDAVLSGLLQNYGKFLASLNGAVEPESVPRPARDEEALRRAEAEIRDLEGLFRREPPPAN
jgi:hypothetical protein